MKNKRTELHATNFIRLHLKYIIILKKSKKKENKIKLIIIFWSICMKVFISFKSPLFLAELILKQGFALLHCKCIEKNVPHSEIFNNQYFVFINISKFSLIIVSSKHYINMFNKFCFNNKIIVIIKLFIIIIFIIKFIKIIKFINKREFLKCFLNNISYKNYNCYFSSVSITNRTSVLLHLLLI